MIRPRANKYQFDRVSAYAKVANGVNMVDWKWDSSSGTNGVTAAAASGGAISAGNGYVRMTTTTTTGSTAYMLLSNQPAGRWIYGNNWILAGRMRVNTTPDSSTRATTGSDGFQMGAVGPTSTTNFVIHTLDTGVAIDTDWHDFAAVRQGATVYCYVDGSLVGTIAAGTIEGKPSTLVINNGSTAVDADFSWLIGAYEEPA